MVQSARLDSADSALDFIYSAELEKEIFDRVSAHYAPHLPPARLNPPRDAQTPEERQGLIDYAIWNGSHDLFIVQVVARGISTLFKDDTEFQFALARQLGDDGLHALASRERITALSGSDGTERIAAAVRHHWQVLGDFPLSSWQAFLAWELHFEHHILARLFVNRRSSQIVDLPTRDFAENRIMPDEEYHRIKITEWWLRKLKSASFAQREHWVGEVLEADEKLQRLLGGYLRDSWALNARASGIDTRNYIPLYDGWRREILALLTGRSIAELPSLTSLAGVDREHEAALSPQPETV